MDECLSIKRWAQARKMREPGAGWPQPEVDHIKDRMGQTHERPAPLLRPCRARTPACVRPGGTGTAAQNPGQSRTVPLGRLLSLFQPAYRSQAVFFFRYNLPACVMHSFSRYQVCPSLKGRYPPNPQSV